MGSLFLFTIFSSSRTHGSDYDGRVLLPNHLLLRRIPKQQQKMSITHTHTQTHTHQTHPPPPPPPPPLRTSLFTNTNSDSSASLHSPASPTCPPRRLIPEMET